MQRSAPPRGACFSRPWEGLLFCIPETRRETEREGWKERCAAMKREMLQAAVGEVRRCRRHCLQVVRRVAVLRARLLRFCCEHHCIPDAAEVLIHRRMARPSATSHLLIVHQTVRIHTVQACNLLHESELRRRVRVARAAFQLHAIDAIAERSLSEQSEGHK